jgi:hypothetical protein
MAAKQGPVYPICAGTRRLDRPSRHAAERRLGFVFFVSLIIDVIGVCLSAWRAVLTQRNGGWDVLGFVFWVSLFINVIGFAGSKKDATMRKLLSEDIAV